MRLELKSKLHIDSPLKVRLLRQLYREKLLSCADLSKKSGKSVPLVSKLLSDLVKDGYVLKHGYAPSSGGRRPLMYSLNADKGLLLSVAMDQLFTRIAVMNLANEYVSGPETIELNLHEAPDALERLIEIIEDHLAKGSFEKSRLLGVGVGMPGFINTEQGVNHTFLRTNSHASQREFLSERLGMQVYIDNDSSLIALAELQFGMAKNRKNVMVVNIGWGTGLGMIVDGQLFRGHSGYAGEFSHIPLTDNDVICECGKRGCLETETSLLLLAQRAVDEIKKGRSTRIKLNDVSKMCDEILIAASKGDQFSIELFTDIGFKLGKGVAILIHIMNPELVVLSGRGSQAGRILMAPIQQALNKFCIPRLLENTELTISQMGFDAALIGAAALVMEHADYLA